MLSNRELRRKRLVDGNRDSHYKFNQEETSYDKVMRVLNNQQNRIMNMLKKYGEDAEDAASSHHRAVSLATIDESVHYFNARPPRAIDSFEELSAGSVRLTPKSQPKSEHHVYEVQKQIRRLEASMPLRKKNDGNRHMYNMYGYSDYQLPRLSEVRSGALVRKRRPPRELDSMKGRRSKNEVIQSLYNGRRGAKPNNSKGAVQQQIEGSSIDITQPVEASEHIQPEEDLSSDEEESVPLPQYYSEFRQVVRKQTVQQMNFLYFSKNEPMKSWTENILTMFERHDKELRQLRKRTKYLERFDEHFFTADAFVE